MILHYHVLIYFILFHSAIGLKETSLVIRNDSQKLPLDHLNIIRKNNVSIINNFKQNDAEFHLEHFKIGFLAPWNAAFDEFSALTSASAISLAIEKVHADPILGKIMRFR